MWRTLSKMSQGAENVSILGFIGAKDDGSGNNWNYKTCKDPVKMSPPTNQHKSFFYRPDALPVAQPTVSKHRREIINLHHRITKTLVHIKTHNQFLPASEEQNTSTQSPAMRHLSYKMHYLTTP